MKELLIAERSNAPEAFDAISWARHILNNRNTLECGMATGALRSAR
jgi:hypothetical protein